MNAEEEQVNIEVSYESTYGFCPVCKMRSPVHDHHEERRWRHLDTCQKMTYIVCRTPRVKCKDHGIKTINVPWVSLLSRATMLYDRFAIDLLKASKNQTKVGELLRVSFDMIHHIVEKAVERGLSRREETDMRYVGIDEKSMNVITDLKSTSLADKKRTTLNYIFLF